MRAIEAWFLYLFDALLEVVVSGTHHNFLTAIEGFFAPTIAGTKSVPGLRTLVHHQTYGATVTFW